MNNKIYEVQLTELDYAIDNYSNQHLSVETTDDVDDTIEYPFD